MTYIIDGRKIAAKREAILKEKIDKLPLKPSVVSILIGSDPPSVLYTEIKRKKAEDLGIDFKPFRLPEDTNFLNVVAYIQMLNRQSGPDGVMVQLPVPKKFLKKHSEHDLLKVINSDKDVDGLTGKGKFLCAAVAAVLTILKEEKIIIKNKKAVVLGASDLVGKPIAQELAKLGAKVTVCDKNTPHIPSITRQADLIVSATGQSGLLTGDMVKKGVIVIDIGAEKVGNKVVGDVDFESVAPKALKITPVPGGVGPVTVISLMENVVKSYTRRN